MSDRLPVTSSSQVAPIRMSLHLFGIKVLPWPVLPRVSAGPGFGRTGGNGPGGACETTKCGELHHTPVTRANEDFIAAGGSSIIAPMNMRHGKRKNRLETCAVLKRGLSSSRSLGRLLAAALVVWLAGATLAAAQSQELRLLTSPWPPSNFVGTDGAPAGISVDVVEALKEKLQLQMPVEILPWARGYLIAQSDPNVLLFSAGRTPERVDMGFHFIGPVLMWTHSLMARKGADYDIHDLASVQSQNLVAAGVRGSWQIRLLQEAGIRTVETESHETGARMLLADRVDIWITSRLQASEVLKDLGVEADSVAPVHTVRLSPSYLMFSSQTDPEVVSRWIRAYDELKGTDFFEKTAEKWSKRLGIALRFDPDEGFSAIPAPEDKTGS